jgi:Ca-activated chloride channel family protein
MLVRFIRLFSALFAGCLLLMVVSRADRPIQAAPSSSQLPSGVSDQTYRVNVDLVNVLCSVFDKTTNTFVTTLSRDDFDVYEDGQKQAIKNFASETNLPLTLAMLVDTSNSVAPKLRFIQETATSFFQSILRNNDRAMLVEFDTSVTLLQDFTGDPNKMAKQIRQLRAAGSTALYDAIYSTCDQKLIRETGRKAIIIISDGQDNVSKASMRESVEMALRAESTIFPISVNKGGMFGTGDDTKKGDDILQEMAHQTGGKTFSPFKVEELDNSFRQINQELRSQYNIGYFSTNPARDGGYRKIEIKVREKNLRLNYRKGYYAPAN